MEEKVCCLKDEENLIYTLYKLMRRLGFYESDLMKMNVENECIVIRPRKVRAVITKEEVNNAIKAMMSSMIDNGFTGDVDFVGDLVECNMDAFLNKLDIVVED